MKTKQILEKNGKFDGQKNKTVEQKLFFNRELSFLEFNRRVLYEAKDKKHPLLERLKFLCIFSSNLDEFFMIRVAGLKRQVESGVVELSMDGLTPREQLKEIRRVVLELYKFQENIYYNEILPELNESGIYIHQYKDLSNENKEYLKEYFCCEVLPLLTPRILDQAHPFPNLINRALNIIFVLKDKTNPEAALVKNFVQLSDKIPRLVRIPSKEANEFHYVLVEQVIKANRDLLFPGYEVVSANTFRVTRDADIEIAEDEAEDLLNAISEQIKLRHWGTAVVRLEVSNRMDDSVLNFLQEHLKLEDDEIYRLGRPLKLPDFMAFLSIDRRELKDKPFQTRIPPELLIPNKTIFECISNSDILVHHPFDSFTNSVLKFIRSAAEDPNVLSIKITLYRVGKNAPIVEALMRAAENGKDVVAFVELKARFDEESNIGWAKELENRGVNVVYGVLGFKTHCKIALVIRKEGNTLRKYVHLSTGNYNSVTARIYTDIGLLTANEDFAWDAVHLFNILTGYSKFTNWRKFIVAPINLKQKIIELIRREAEYSTPENPGLIFVKMNSLAHEEVINELYKASQKNVQIKLLIRGICCLVPGLKGISDNIEVRSILGRFLEHSRIFYFKNNGNPEVYLSSADWMTRNLHRRIELMYPVEDPKIKSELINLLELYWRDNTKSWRLKSDGSYEKIVPKEGEKEFCAQQFLLDELEKERKVGKFRIFTIPK
ncbi:polyphosphate kinase 1 [Bacteroidetes/Chlorobi group bacterium Naka2016]|jgi:polyphosphate kinase|nr:MAG: polyphosphate kinase 1 [Bacteroidetes/Chlorobi group bacterium Naka2016]